MERNSRTICLERCELLADVRRQASSVPKISIDRFLCFVFQHLWTHPGVRKGCKGLSEDGNRKYNVGI